MTRQQVDFTEINNPMLRFLLDDGTEINVKLVIMRVVRTDEKLPDGQMKHEFQMQHLVDQVAPGGKIDIKNLAGSNSDRNK